MSHDPDGNPDGTHKSCHVPRRSQRNGHYLRPIVIISDLQAANFTSRKRDTPYGFSADGLQTITSCGPNRFVWAGAIEGVTR